MKFKLPIEICFVLLMVSFVRADGLLDCSGLPVDYGDCHAIASDPLLTDAEKKEGILGLAGLPTVAENHNLAFEWNKNIKFSSAHAGVSMQGGEIISSAWVKVVGISPSVLDMSESVLLADSAGNVLSAYNYNIVLPDGPAPGDCKTVYSYTMEKEDLGIFLNDSHIGSGKVVPFSTGAGANKFRAMLELIAKLKIDHYKEYTTCWVPGWDWTCSTSCIFSHMEYKDDEVTVSDFVNAETRAFSYDFRMAYNDSNGLDTVLLKFEASQPFNELNFKLDDASLMLSELSYNLDYSLAPYDALHVRREQVFSKKKESLVEIAFENEGEYFAEFAVEKKAGNCSINLSNDFSEFDLGSKCNLSDLPDAVVKLDVDKNAYEAGELVKVKVLLADDVGAPLGNSKIKLEYGLESVELITDGEGQAETEISAAESKGVISAEFRTDFEHGSGSDTERINVVYDDTSET
ncbi:MAG: hypothetical protein ABIF92_00920, partial [archaeon]